MNDALPLLRTLAETLDSLVVAFSVFDDADRVLLWNRAFLRFFPEHAGHIHEGEPYRANLRRFYEGRLSATELPALERYIDEGLARHRAQQRPFAFEHRGLRLRVASLPLSGIGRIRIWQAVPAPGRVALTGAPGVPPIDGTAVFDHLAEGVMVTDADHRIAWVNEPFVIMYRFADRAAAAGGTLEDAYRTAWHGEETGDPALFERGLAILTDSLRYAGAPFEVPLPGARWTRVVEQKSPDGRSFFVHVDITELKRQQEELLRAERRARDSELLLADTLERMEQGILLMNAERVVVVCNRRAIELLDLPEELMKSRPSFDAVLAYQFANNEFAHTPQDIHDFILSGRILDRPSSYDRKRPDGRIIEVLTVPVEGGGALRTYTDITDRKRGEERIRHVSRHDGLTSLVNREVFLEHLAGAVEASGRGGETFAVHFIDLDRFKPINDQFGHAVGDKVLALVAERMRNIAREVDVVARMGGDEFAILQYGVERASGALHLARRILEGVAQPMDIEAHQLAVGASIGIARYPAAGGDPDTLLRHADAAMYAAKASGGNCVRTYEAGDATPNVAP
ncbi:MAG: PAS-domain containing protein [Burkholderiales bacterium]|nr:PAS-domain containing protein [Burkholderiales bacterium]